MLEDIAEIMQALCESNPPSQIEVPWGLSTVKLTCRTSSWPHLKKSNHDGGYNIHNFPYSAYIEPYQKALEWCAKIVHSNHTHERSSRHEVGSRSVRYSRAVWICAADFLYVDGRGIPMACAQGVLPFALGVGSIQYSVAWARHCTPEAFSRWKVLAGFQPALGLHSGDMSHPHTFPVGWYC